MSSANVFWGSTGNWKTTSSIWRIWLKSLVRNLLTFWAQFDGDLKIDSEIFEFWAILETKKRKYFKSLLIWVLSSHYLMIISNSKSDIERRRLYDIINILESLGIIYRVSKNCFMWKGLKRAREHIVKVQNQHRNSHFSFS